MVVLLTKAALLHRHLVSETTQPPRSALVVQGMAHAKRVEMKIVRTRDAIFIQRTR